MLSYRPFDRDKAIEVIKYVARNTPNPDIYWIGKILYFADLLHLQRYGRLICGDEYAAIPYGTVPSATLDLMRQARRASAVTELHPAIGEFEIEGKNKVVPLREPNFDFFSQSDIDCLNQSIKENGHLSFGQLHNKSVDSAYNSADVNGFIDIEQIIAMLPNASALQEYIRETSPV